MKKAFACLLALTLALGLFGCAKQETPAQQPSQQPSQQSTDTTAKGNASDPAPAPVTEPAAEEWHFTVQVERSEDVYKADDGTVIATKVYEQPVLRLESTDGEVFTGNAPERGVTAEQLAACEKFNAATTSVGLWDYDIEAEGRETYESRKETGDEMPPVGDEVTFVSANRQGDLLSVLVSDYIYLGGAHPDSGLHAWNFDLEKGEFVDLKSLTDRPDELTEAIVYGIASQINASEYRDGFYENWFDLLLEKDDFEVSFGPDSLLVWLQEYEIGPHAIGVPEFEIPYGTISRFLNDYGEQLLDLPAEARVVGDFHEAQILWSWLDAGAPTDYSDSRMEGDVYYCRVDDPNVHTLADVSAMLSQYVDKAFVDAQLAESDILREFDGVLYAAAAGRGDDMSIASVDYEAQISGESGKVIVTIHRQDFDDATSEWVPTGESDIHEFPFTLRDGHAVFSTMEYIF